MKRRSLVSNRFIFQHSYQHGTLAQDTASRNRQHRAEKRKNLETERTHEFGQAREANPPLSFHQRKHPRKLFPLIYSDWKHVTVAERARVTTSAQTDSPSHDGTALGDSDPSQNQSIDLSDVSLARGAAPV